MTAWHVLVIGLLGFLVVCLAVWLSACLIVSVLNDRTPKITNVPQPPEETPLNVYHYPHVNHPDRWRAVCGETVSPALLTRVLSVVNCPRCNRALRGIGPGKTPPPTFSAPTAPTDDPKAPAPAPERTDVPTHYMPADWETPVCGDVGPSFVIAADGGTVTCRECLRWMYHSNVLPPVSEEGTTPTDPAPAPPVITTHYSMTPYRDPVCGKSQPHHVVTGDREEVTCSECLRWMGRQSRDHYRGHTSESLGQRRAEDLDRETLSDNEGPASPPTQGGRTSIRSEFVKVELAPPEDAPRPAEIIHRGLKRDASDEEGRRIFPLCGATMTPLTRMTLSDEQVTCPSCQQRIVHRIRAEAGVPGKTGDAPAGAPVSPEVPNVAHSGQVNCETVGAEDANPQTANTRYRLYELIQDAVKGLGERTGNYCWGPASLASFLSHTLSESDLFPRSADVTHYRLIGGCLACKASTIDGDVLCSTNEERVTCPACLAWVDGYRTGAHEVEVSAPRMGEPCSGQPGPVVSSQPTVVLTSWDGESCPLLTYTDRPEVWSELMSRLFPKGASDSPAAGTPELMTSVPVERPEGWPELVWHLLPKGAPLISVPLSPSPSPAPDPAVRVALIQAAVDVVKIAADLNKADDTYAEDSTFVRTATAAMQFLRDMLTPARVDTEDAD